MLHKISQTEYDPYAPETTKIGVYVPSVEIYVMQYPWYYDTVNGYENTNSYNTYTIFVGRCTVLQLTSGTTDLTMQQE